MRNLHCSGRFLRFLRSIGAKTACARRAIVALFVVVATILATFMIMPSASMGASSQNESNQEQTQSQTKSENAEPKVEQDVNTAESKADAKDRASASGENGESKSADLRAVESVNPQPSTNPDDSNADHAQNVDSEKKQGAAKEDANKNPNQDVKKDAAERAQKEESANKLRRQKRELGNTRAAAGGDDFPAECKKVGSLAKCYKVKYEPHFSDSGKISVRGQKFSVDPTFKYVKGIKGKAKKDFVTGFELEKLMVSRSEEAKNNGLVTLDSKTGKITVYANKWLKDSNYYAYVKVMYSDGSYTTNFDCPTDDAKCVKVTRPQVRLSFSVARIEGAKGDLSLKVYNHQDSKGRSEVQDTNGVTFTSDDKGNFSSITPIFIDTKSTKKPNPIYHRMICHRDDQRPEIGYTLNNVDGLKLRNTNDATLLDEDDESAEGYTFQKQWDHALGERPGEESAKPYTVYESDLFTERSQSWITGTPNETGDFTCRVFAFNDADFTPNKISVGSYVKLFKLNTENLDDSKLRSIFENPVKAFYADAENGYKDKQKTIDWDVKTLKIKVRKKEGFKEKLSLKVYPFDEAGNNAIDATGTLVPIDNDSTISLMKGVELRPLVEATYNGSTGYGSTGNTGINLSMYCSKGQPDSSTKKLEYKNWMNSAPFTFPDVDNSTSANGQRKRFFDSTTAPCDAHDGTSDCTTMTDSYAIFKPTEAGDYKCIVYAYKDDIKAPTIVQPDGTLKAITPDDMEKALFAQKKIKT
ncbi:hypothetical protein CG391_002950 [Gardnerella piotii]|uniref:Peptidase n=1 Tax=Gardnerella piotii TaxID=2792977 RepID=A0ABU5MPH5_9BIFI|nr:hypothetical protein [Gardnerella piotii]MDZ7544323.1 hypothetical protein [Gardnerella piotii]MDZ7552309.1 hypothetical protein [Gardnerella piotii]